jgi:hypothetical protein
LKDFIEQPGQSGRRLLYWIHIVLNTLDLLPNANPPIWKHYTVIGGRTNMGANETKKTMRFWIFSGIVAIVASQLPLLLKKSNSTIKHSSNNKKDLGG